MSADRYEIDMHDDGTFIITNLNGHRFIVDANCVDIRSRAIRQQARDIAELEVFAEIGRQWNSDSSLAKWFPLTSERVEQDAQEIAKLRTDLAAAVAERGEYWGALHSTKDDLFECRANQRTLESDLRVTRDQRDTLRARLAAIDGAPTVAWLCTADDGLSDATVSKDVRNIYAKSGRVIAELIARPAKD